MDAEKVQEVKKVQEAEKVKEPKKVEEPEKVVEAAEVEKEHVTSPSIGVKRPGYKQKTFARKRRRVAVEKSSEFEKEDDT